MSHEINLIALNITFRRWEASSVADKLGLAPVLHTLNAGDLVLRDQHQYLLQHCIEKLGFLYAIIMRWTLCLMLKL